MTGFMYRQHYRYLKRCFGCLPTEVEAMEPSRPTLLFFALSAADCLGALSTLVNEEERERMIEWLYSMQVAPMKESDGSYVNVGGFRGTLCSVGKSPSTSNVYDSGNLAMTYSALNCLLILGDDLSRVNRQHILETLARCQQADGSFCVSEGSESDIRFVYCACAIAHVLRAPTDCFDVECTIDFIRRSQSYEGGFGQTPGAEAHGGSTYCAVASLYLLDRLYDYESHIRPALSSSERDSVIAWCLSRQASGLHGRMNKPDDTCYTFWIGATLQMLDSLSLLDKERLRAFLLKCQDEQIGGFGRTDDSRADLMHTYLSLAGLSLLHEPHLMPFYAPLNITRRAHQAAKHIQRRFERDLHNNSHVPFEEKQSCRGSTSQSDGY